jgi:NAD dependent epimerase/dehydratase
MSFWKNKNVAVTGADGFIGSHLVESLLEHGAQVKALSYYNSFNSWGWLDVDQIKSHSGIQVVAGDVRDPLLMDTFLEGAEIVFHLAALIGIPYSYIAPKSYLDTNVTGTYNVLESCRKAKVKHLLVTSTSEVYGTAVETPIHETHIRQPQSPYSASKIAADALALSYYLSFELPVTIVRPFNTYGPRQSSRAFIPTVICQLLSGRESIRLGSLSPTRDMVFVKDTAEGFLRIAESKALIGEEVNIATNKEVSMGDLAQAIIKQINPNVRLETDDQRVRPQKSEVFQLLGSNQKLKNFIGWTPEISLESGLQQTIKWFKASNQANLSKSDLYNV